MLKVRDLSGKTANEQFDQLTFKVENGQVLALLGRANSGKHLLAKVLGGQLKPATGDTIVNNYRRRTHSDRAQIQVGYLSCPAVVEPYLTGFEWLDLIGSLYHLGPSARATRIKELDDSLQIGSEMFSLLETTSASGRQKIALAAAVIHQPSVLVLDQPTQDLDFVDQRRVVRLIQTVAATGASVVLSSDNIDFTSQVSDQYLILDEGAKRLDGSLKELINQTRPKAHSLHGVLESIYGEF